MTKTFNGFGAFVAHLQMCALKVPIAANESLEAACVILESETKKEFGVYQQEAGVFDEWAELAASTKRQRLALGYTENEPLLRSGKLRDSITHEVEGLEAAVGSDMLIAVWQELGTWIIPPRPFLGPAAYRNQEQIKALIGLALVYGVLGKEMIYPPFILRDEN